MNVKIQLLSYDSRTHRDNISRMHYMMAFCTINCFINLPAELIFTWRGTCNMHTTLVLLYWPFTFWTGLRICQNPESQYRV